MLPKCRRFLPLTQRVMMICATRMLARYSSSEGASGVARVRGAHSMTCHVFSYFPPFFLLVLSRSRSLLPPSPNRSVQTLMHTSKLIWEVEPAEQSPSLFPLSSHPPFATHIPRAGLERPSLTPASVSVM